MVDLNTGDFNYSLPVMSVPGPNGENVPITFSYHGGIKVEQQASWIGLGWDYNPGEIMHGINGVSDDWKGKQQQIITTPVTGSVTTESTLLYGPLYFKFFNNANGTSAMDIAKSSYKLTSGLFQMPDYDAYHVSGPGIGGTMQLKLFDHSGVLTSKNSSDGTFEYSPAIDDFTKENPNFIFTNEINGSINPANVTGGYSGTYNVTDNRAHTASYIEYFTNAQINLNPAGFLDYKIASTPRRHTDNFDADDIGAFRITNSSGRVYHYSLPVYMHANEQSSSFSLTFPNSVDNTKEMKVVKKTGKYVVSWKLTAVTGPDYVDVNTNGMADVGDTGYWIAYNYGLWADNFKWRSPFFNYHPNQFSKSTKPVNTNPISRKIKEFSEDGTVSSGVIQTYYLNSIQTSTHTAYFIKDVRADGHAVKDGSNIKPTLRLNRIVLLRNEDIPLMFTSASLPVISGFNFSGCSESSVLPHIGNYTANEFLIKTKSIAAVELISDYSLCKLAYNNINNVNSFSSATVTWNSTNSNATAAYESASASTATANNSSGKLTLNEIKIYTLGYKAAGPSHLFDYDQGNSTKNPNYALEKSDIWGYYKSDYDPDNKGKYTSLSSGANADAWSLKKITTPHGGEILIEYESDIYNYSCNNNRSYTSPARYFLIHTATIPLNSNTEISVSSDINSFLSSASRKEVGLPVVFTGGSGSGCSAEVAANAAFIGANPVFTTGGAGMTLASTTGAPTGLQKFILGATANWTDCIPTAYTYNKNRANGYGHLKLSFDSLPGAGTRVKSITMKDTESNLSYINEYSYRRGIAGSEPVNVLVRSDYGVLEKNSNAGDPFIPSPVVTYQKVIVRSKSLNNVYNGRTIYEFYNSYEPYQVTASAPDISLDDYTHWIDNITMNYVAIKTSGILNNLKSVTVYDNNENILRLTRFDYLTASDQIPQFVEKHRQYVTVMSYDGPTYNTYYTLQGIHSFKDRKARLSKKTDYFNDITTTEEYLAWDAITGEVIQSRITNATEGITETDVVPAFRESAYALMGPKSVDPSNKNFPAFTFKVTVFKDKVVRDVNNQVHPSGNRVLIGGDKTTWQTSYLKRTYNNSSSLYVNQSATSSIWHPYQTFSFNGNSNHTLWKYEGEATVFNNRNTPIESKNGNDRYAASKMGYDNRFVLCQASDAKYADFTFSSFEDQVTAASSVIHFGGEVTQGTMRYAGDATVKPHTGNYMAKVEPGFGPGHFAKGFTAGRSYRASVWVHKNSPAAAALYVTLDGSTAGSAYALTKSIAKSDAANITVGDWILMTITIDVPSNYLESGGSLNDLRVYCNNPGSTTAYYDDLMVRPVDAALSGNVIDEKTGQTLAVLDSYDFATRYVYDDAGRVREIWTETAAEGWKLKQRYSYNFKRTY
jgi:hypothetical protein